MAELDAIRARQIQGRQQLASRYAAIRERLDQVAVHESAPDPSPSAPSTSPYPESQQVRRELPEPPVGRSAVGQRVAAAVALRYDRIAANRAKARNR